MFHTAEIRWFLEGAPDAEVQRWFDASAIAREDDPRIDSYLLLPGCTTCGVKIRQGHFEIKAQTLSPRIVSYANGIAGKRTAWVKWSSGIAGAQLVQEQQGPEAWVQVEKSRTLRLFELSGEIREREATKWLSGPGCFVELARLRIGCSGGSWSKAAEWWSVCFEAFAGQQQSSGHLETIASSEVLRPLGAALPNVASMSYPEWLARQTVSIAG